METPVRYILQLRTNPVAAAALRRGASAASEHYAYGYLAALWSKQPYLRVPLLQFSALAATYPTIRMDSDLPLGAVYAHVVAATPARQEGIEKKLMALQQQHLPGFVGSVRATLSMVPDESGLNWEDLYWLMRGWDHPDTTKRRATRRRVLEQYYALSLVTLPTQVLTSPQNPIAASTPSTTGANNA